MLPVVNSATFPLPRHSSTDVVALQGLGCIGEDRRLLDPGGDRTIEPSRDFSPRWETNSA